MFKKWKVVYFFLVAMVGHLHTNAEVLTLNLDALPEFTDMQSMQKYENQVVQVRGFWYPLASDEGILSLQSGLRSCCLALPKKINQQILVKGPIKNIPSQRVATMKGTFKILPLQNNEGALIQLYVLESAQVVQPGNAWAPMLLLFLACMFLFKLFRKFRKCNTKAQRDKDAKTCTGIRL